ncbi:DEAD/DEAH box helicase [Desulfovibrio inopinatus]|uniref:DEAD/DEAH box helicase n=1 Tax=Desulfovibrio inopinatus TaxID=102109 RepID=UPI00040EA0CA|nr:DEAD/DEAH box helicase [Desulfovibrio inopinatus]
MKQRDVNEYIEALKAAERLSAVVTEHRVVEGHDAVFGEPVRPWPTVVRELLEQRGISQLYAHQARAADLVRAGKNIVAATPTASGKTLTYTLPVLDQILRDRGSRALYLFPLKALAQDQLRVVNTLLNGLPASARPRAAIYDGDTSANERKKLRKDPPHILMTNPEMVHLSLLPHHQSWAGLFGGLTHVVVDEVHTYRGVMGSNMAHVFRRMHRVCGRFGAQPTYIFCSATIGNPEELTRNLTGLECEPILESGAPAGRRHYVFLDPLDSASSAAITLLRAALARELRTIVYTQSRKMTELLAMWVAEKAGDYASRISAYRSGFLPEERREIEAKMALGELLAVISTSALELGIDIGELDLCIMVGYPGSIMATFQRGGRVGRSQRDSAVILVAGEDALDQYFVHHPQELFDRPAESAVINPDNPVIAGRHIECAAAELPLSDGEAYLQGETGKTASQLELQGRLLRNAEGDTIYSARTAPHRDVGLRGAGKRFVIELQDGDRRTTIGEIDEYRACRETHPGAVYLHRGQVLLVDDLNLAEGTVTVVRQRVDYFTRVRGNKETEILSVDDEACAFGMRVFRGRLRVTEHVTGYEKRQTRGNRLMTIVPLDLPPFVFETEGFWFAVPRAVQDEVDRQLYHFRGGIHAVEHAVIGFLPLVVMTDRNDLGGISTELHPQLGRAAVFVYDGVPGGVGLTRQAFAKAEDVMRGTLAAIAGCECETGCPSCVHSPKCGSGNRPIDKAAAECILRLLDEQTCEPEAVTVDISPANGPEQDVRPAQDATSVLLGATSTLSAELKEHGMANIIVPKRYGVLDVETRRSAEEVGGWGKASKMGVSVAVLYDSEHDRFDRYEEDAVPALIERMQSLDLVIGFNVLRFDYRVLGGITRFSAKSIPTLDLLDAIKNRLGYRVSLDNLAQATFGVPKSADGLQALQWWKEGNLEDIAKYCTEDVRLTRDLYLYGKEHGHVLFTNKTKKIVRVPTGW